MTVPTLFLHIPPAVPNVELTNCVAEEGAGEWKWGTEEGDE